MRTWRAIGRSSPAATVLGVGSSRPSRLTANLNVDAVIEFREFDCGECDAGKLGRWQRRWWLVLSTGVLCGRRGISVSVGVSSALLNIIFVHGGQAQGAEGAQNHLGTRTKLSPLALLAHKTYIHI